MNSRMPTGMPSAKPTAPETSTISRVSPSARSSTSAIASDISEHFYVDLPRAQERERASDLCRAAGQLHQQRAEADPGRAIGARTEQVDVHVALAREGRHEPRSLGLPAQRDAQ